MTKNIKVLIPLIAKQGRLEEAERIIMEMIPAIRNNPNCLEFRVFKDMQNPNKFTLLEYWINMEAITEHSKKPYMAEIMAKKSIIFEGIAGEIVSELSTIEN
ncbi:MAG: antibiotic biosynthesis monooxygenase [Alphaproteobacteria bacterium]|jgi:quinol monooxygenase YgiN|nr:antibiotic biosynthesis monooxygenase [Alphaproteobacteria bacterium]